MIRIERFFALLLLAIVCFSFQSAHARPLNFERAVIKNLLAYIENADVVFVRNGKEYKPEVARKHLEKKLNWAGERIQKAEHFITYIASKSSRSGEDYFVKLPNGDLVKSHDWLMQKLVLTANRRTL